MAVNRTREPAEKLKPIVDPAAWDAAEMKNSESWVYCFADKEIDEILTAARALVTSGIDIIHVGKEDFVLPKTAATFAEIYDELKNGRGFVQMRGLPVDEICREETAAVLWGVGTHFGKALSQNPEGHVLGHVKDLGKNYNDPMVRGYQTKAAMTFHADPCDMVALLCVNTAKFGGESRVASSVTLYNEMLKRRPELVADLCEDFFGPNMANSHRVKTLGTNYRCFRLQVTVLAPKEPPPTPERHRICQVLSGGALSAMKRWICFRNSYLIWPLTCLFNREIYRS